MQPMSIYTPGPDYRTADGISWSRSALWQTPRKALQALLNAKVTLCGRFSKPRKNPSRNEMLDAQLQRTPLTMDEQRKLWQEQCRKDRVHYRLNYLVTHMCMLLLKPPNKYVLIVAPLAVCLLTATAFAIYTFVLAPIFVTTTVYVELEDFTRTELTNFALPSPSIGLDADAGYIILTRITEDVPQGKLQYEKISIQSRRSRREWRDVPSKLSNCQQLSQDVFCCSQSDAFHNGTNCYSYANDRLKEKFEENYLMTNFVQTLANEGTMVGLMGGYHYAYRVLDTNRGRMYSVNFDEQPNNLIPAAYYFSMENLEELTELARDYDKPVFSTCEFVRDNHHHFRLAGDQRGRICDKTRLEVRSCNCEIVFCANPVYRAVVQYEKDKKLDNPDEELIDWLLQVSYNDERDRTVYLLKEVEESVASTGGTRKIAMSCEPTGIDIYIVGVHVLLKYSVSLPRVDFASLLANVF